MTTQQEQHQNQLTSTQTEEELRKNYAEFLQNEMASRRAQMMQNNQQSQMANTNSGQIGFGSLYGNEIYRIDSSGNLGIGTATHQRDAQQARNNNLEFRARMDEREACAQLVINMAEELGCPNLLHGVAMAIKMRKE
jgi:hypothetical protein